MNYIGSKQRLREFIKSSIYSVTGKSLENKIFCDLFAGTGIVGRSFKAEVKQLIANDYEYYSFILNRNYIGNSKVLNKADEYIYQLNNITPIEGFIYTHYCKGGSTERLYFSDENGKKIDAIRTKIEALKNKNEIEEDMYSFLLASLIESADKVANTASVYGSFLKNIKKTAAKAMELNPAIFETTSQTHQVFNLDSNELIKQIKGDILYLDPPYNSRQYGSNYHLLNTIAFYNNFKPKGKTGVRAYAKSKYCSRKYVIETFEELIKNSQFNYIFLSYNNEGLMSVDAVKKTMSKYGKYDLVTKQYKRFIIDKTAPIKKGKTTKEYLHILEKS